jgi:hypothetical protein
MKQYMLLPCMFFFLFNASIDAQDSRAKSKCIAIGKELSSFVKTSADTAGAAVRKRLFPVKRLYSAYAASLLLSGCVGAATGGIVRYLEKQLQVQSSPVSLFLVLLGWAIESELRRDVILGLQQDLDAYQVAHKKNMMFNVAWIASWLAYLHE